MGHKNRGLTLTEVMVVVAILSVLTLSIYTVFKSGIDAWSKSETHLEVYQNARVALDQISRELPGAFVGGVAGGFQGEDSNPDTLVLVTTYGGATYQIRYSLDTARGVLIRQHDENPEDFANPVYTDIDFAFNINGLNFDYYPQGGAAWGDSGLWNNTATLPAAVRIMIECIDSDGNTYPFETVVYLPNSE
jgi:prepilin-type N-terminal cleavage/methylation domain-containing protein